jgi:HlyD family secretion protein
MRPETPTARGGLCVGLAAAVLAVAGCGRPVPPGDPAGPAPSASEPASVAVVRPQRRSLRRVVEQPGTVQAYEETHLFARVPGYVRLPLEADGRIVSDIDRRVRGPKLDASGKETAPGDVLAEIVVPELEQEARQKRAMVRQAEAEVALAEKAVASAAASVVVADAGVAEAQAFHDRWQSESKRMERLSQGGVVDAQSRDETLNQFRGAAGRLASARAAVLKARAERDRAGADVEAARARVDVARADAGKSEAWLGYARIRAPFDGVVTRRRVNTGDFVQPAAGKGDWLFTVARLDPVRVVVAVPEADAPLVRARAAVRIRVPALGGPDRSGTVARTSWDLDPSSRTLRAEIDLANGEGLLRPGMYVYAHVSCELPPAWTLPASALVRQGDATVCYLVREGKAARTPVQVGRGDGQFTEVLGLQKPGAPVSWEEVTGKETVALRAAGLSDGQVVQADPAGAASPPR